METVRILALQKALELVGGVEPLAARLGIASGTLRLFLRGALRVPESVFLRAVDILSDHALRPVDENGGERPAR